MRARLPLFTLLTMLAAMGARAGEQVLHEEICFDLERLGQVVEGFGVQHWAGQRAAAEAFPDLNITHIRITKDWDSWYDMRDLYRKSMKLGIKWVYVKWAVPKKYLGEDGQLADVRGFADEWIQTIRELNAGSCRPHFIDLLNEPDYFGIPPGAYNELVKLVRKGVDDGGYRDIRIIGPGLTHIGVDNFQKYYDALDGEACAGLAAWATHAWEDANADGSGGVEITEQRAREFVELCRRRSPDKPIWYTEYATRQTRFHGIQYPHPDRESENYCASFTMPYAVRVFENTLAILNQGANIPFYWSSGDYRNSKKQWGLIGPDGEKKPVYFALKALYGNIKLGSRVILPPDGMSGLNVYAGAFRYAELSGEETVVVALANASAAKRKALVRLENPPPAMRLIKAEEVRLKKRGDLKKKRADVAELRQKRIRLSQNNRTCEFEVTLARDSALTVVLGGTRR